MVQIKVDNPEFPTFLFFTQEEVEYTDTMGDHSYFTVNPKMRISRLNTVIKQAKAEEYKIELIHI